MKDLTKNPHLTQKNAKGEIIVTKLEDARFFTRAEMIEAMQDKRYKTDADFRDLVGHMVNRGFVNDEVKGAPAQVVSGRTLARAMSDPERARKLEDAAIFREKSLAMFSDPRYATSPSYRREVEDWLRANNDAIDAQMPAGTLVDRNQPQHRQAYRVTIGENSDEFNFIKQGIRDKAAAEEKAILAEKHAALDRGESADRYDVSGLKIT